MPSPPTTPLTTLFASCAGAAKTLSRIEGDSTLAGVGVGKASLPSGTYEIIFGVGFGAGATGLVLPNCGDNLAKSDGPGDLTAGKATAFFLTGKVSPPPSINITPGFNMSLPHIHIALLAV
jgi:hypothetical protein